MKPRILDLSLFDAGYDTATELLTTRGWQRYDTLENDDRMFAWTNGRLELERVPECYTRRYEGKMYQIENRHIDIFCMPGTKIVARVRKHTRTEMEEEWTDTRAEYIKDSWQLQIPVSGRWEGVKTVLPGTAYEIGLWSSGVLEENAAVKLDRESVQALHQLVEGRSFEPRTDQEYRRLHRLMSKNYPDRELTWDMIMWDYDSRLQLVLGLMDGRGRRYPPALVWLFLSTKEGRLNIFQALCMSLDWRAQISTGNGVFFSKDKNTSSVLYRHRKPPENWQGHVWNIKTDAGHMVVRRNSKIAIVSTL